MIQQQAKQNAEQKNFDPEVHLASTSKPQTHQSARSVFHDDTNIEESTDDRGIIDITANSQQEDTIVTKTEVKEQPKEAYSLPDDIEES